MTGVSKDVSLITYGEVQCQCIVYITVEVLLLADNEYTTMKINNNIESCKIIMNKLSLQQ